MPGDRMASAPSLGGGARGDEPLVRVGVDLVAVEEVRASVERLGRRYLDRLFTEHELSCCGSVDAVRVESLAARFAAQEAALKVLRPDGARPEWRDIEVRRNDDGSCDLRLHGEAAALAARDQVQGLSVSLSHEAGMAVAVVAGTCRPSSAGTTRIDPTAAHMEPRAAHTEPREEGDRG